MAEGEEDDERESLAFDSNSPWSWRRVLTTSQGFVNVTAPGFELLWNGLEFQYDAFSVLDLALWFLLVEITSFSRNDSN